MDLNNRSIERMDTTTNNTNKTIDNNGSTGNTGTSSGSLRAKISLKGGYSQLAMVCPFYGMKNELPRKILFFLYKILKINFKLQVLCLAVLT